MKLTPLQITAALLPLLLAGCVVEQGLAGPRYDNGGYFGDSGLEPIRQAPSRWDNREAYDYGQSFGIRDKRQGLNRQAGRHTGSVPPNARAEFIRGYNSGWTTTDSRRDDRGRGNDRDRNDNRGPNWDRDDYRDRDDNRGPNWGRDDDRDRDDYRGPGRDRDDNWDRDDNRRPNDIGQSGYPSRGTQWTARQAYDNGFQAGTSDRTRGVRSNPAAHLGAIPSQARNEFSRGYEAGYGAPVRGGRGR